ncbi:helix-turn-helix domain-containing protein [Yokenella regensburgei]|uniref:helix-turn-helix domain-containing protein n=1 Tax=Yokenella regensburgei TaxID=158877 RepID=UPI003ED908D8
MATVKRQKSTLEHYEVYTGNQFLAEGISHLMERLKNSLFVTHIIFFTEEQYFNAVSASASYCDICFVFLVENNELLFLDDMPLYRISVKSSLDQFTSLLLKVNVSERFCHPENTSMILTSREISILKMIREGSSIKDMVASTGLHIKTIYQVRSSARRKLGCKTTIELCTLCKGKLFINWTNKHQKLVKL